MAWLPIGPDFVFTPRNPNFKRLSRRNEVGQQCLVSTITVDPTDALTIYVCDRPSSGGATTFRTRDGGQSWTPITDALQRSDPRIDPVHLAVNPDHPEIIYLATFWTSALYVSNDRGDTWSPARSIGGFARKLVVDTRTSSNPSMTVLYAATAAGVFRSADGGATWSAAPVFAGDIWSLEAHTPATGMVFFYAGLGGGNGVGYSNSPDTAAGWVNLVTAATGWPAPGSYDLMLVDFCRSNPARAYAWVLKAGATVGLYTTSVPLTSWSAVTMNPQLNPDYGYYDLLFAVAPNSPGDGLNDILVFGNKEVFRSIDAGRNWTGDAVEFHVDTHAIAFSTYYPSTGVVPTTFIGDDGGIAKSSTFADPATSINPAPADFNEGFTVSDTFAWQNLSHARQSVAVYQYASVPGFPALSYVCCQDTGIAAGVASLGWRGIGNADVTQIAAAKSSNEVTVWANTGQYGVWPVYLIDFWRDNGEVNPPWGGHCTLNGSFMASRSAFVVGLDNKCLVGVAIRDTATTLINPVTASTLPQTVTPAAMTNVIVGSVLFIDDGAANAEIVSVTATTVSSFTAVFANNHAAGASVSVQREVIARIDENGAGSQISQDFSPNQVTGIAPSPTDPNILYAFTSASRVFMTNAGAAATAATVWNEVTTGRPMAVGSIAGITINGLNDAYVILNAAMTVGAVTSPLFKVTGSSWQIQTCTGLPQPASGFSALLADPAQNTVLYTHTGFSVYSIVIEAGSWQWQDITVDLPGVPIYDLDIVNAGITSPKVLLRAALTTRCVYEADVTAGAIDPRISLYLRDNFLDTGLTNPSPDFLFSPYKSADLVTHYQCADIKIDARQNGATTGTNFYQTDPEGNPVPPLSHVLFDQLKDNSQNLPQADQAWVHVQVHNRSSAPSGSVAVWAIYCDASAGVPALSASVSMMNNFPFWGQFSATGTIVPNLPADSPWKSVGSPRTLSALAASTPQVASWNWIIPVLSSGDTGHFCMVAFVHSVDSPVGESIRMIVDEITPTNRQVGQNNLHIGAPLPPTPGPKPWIREYIEFHNPMNQILDTDLEIDLRSMPKPLAVSFWLTKLNTAQPLAVSITSTSSATPDPAPTESRTGSTDWLKALLEFLRMIICWFANLFRMLFGAPVQPCTKPRRPVVELPRFDSQKYEAITGALVRVEGVRFQPFEFGAVLLKIENTGALSKGSEYRLEVRQRIRISERKVRYWGGCTYVIKIAGDKQHSPVHITPSHDPNTPPDVAEHIERKAREFRWYPSLFAKNLAAQRDQEYGG